MAQPESVVNSEGGGKTTSEQPAAADAIADLHSSTPFSRLQKMCILPHAVFKFFHLSEINCSMFWLATLNMFHHLTQLDFFGEYLVKKADISSTGLHGKSKFKFNGNSIPTE